MKKTTFILGSFLAVLLLSGCVGRGGEPSPNVSQETQQTVQGIGDADINVNQPAEDNDILPGVEPVEADNTTITTPPSGNPPGIVDIGDSIDVVQINESDFIIDVDVVEQGSSP